MTLAQQHGKEGGQTSAHARAWIVRLHSGDVAQRDLKALANWRAESAANEAAYQGELRMWHALGPALAGQSAAAASPKQLPEMTRMPRTIGAPDTASAPLVISAAQGGRPALASRRGFLGGALTATVAVALGVGLLARPDEAGARVLETGRGETRRFALAPGLTITLNTDSRVVFWPATGAPRLKLDRGEAIIGVALTGETRLRAEATRCAVTAQRAKFLLRLDGDSTRVACLAGRISVRSDGRDIALSETRSVVLGGNEAGPVAAGVTETEGAWQRGLFVFDNRPAGEVVAELNRYRPGYVYLPHSRSAVRISGVLSVDQPDLAVDHIARMLGAKVTRLPGGVAVVR